MSALPNDILESLSASGLISSDDLQAVAAASPPPEDAQSYLEALVSRGSLTSFQAEVALSGQQHTLVFGEYVVLDRIGAGGMGEVFKAVHKRMDRTVAVKRLPAAMMQSPAAVQRFYREVKAAARLHHPNIVAAYDAGEAHGSHYLVMEYVDGEDLSAVIRSRGKLPIAQAVDVILQAARGLAYAHKQGVIHRDIKPGNILLARDGSAKMLDMGLARTQQLAEQVTGEAEATLTIEGRLLGTVEYMAPEQAANAKLADARSDIYSVGCTLYRCVTGQLPYGGSTAVEKIMAHTTRPIPSLRNVESDVPEALDRLYQRMIAKSPDDRPQSMDEVVAALETMIREGVVPAWDASLAMTDIASAAPFHSPRIDLDAATSGAVDVASNDEQVAVDPDAMTLSDVSDVDAPPTISHVGNAAEKAATPTDAQAGGPTHIDAGDGRTINIADIPVARPARKKRSSPADHDSAKPSDASLAAPAESPGPSSADPLANLAAEVSRAPEATSPPPPSPRATHSSRSPKRARSAESEPSPGSAGRNKKKTVVLACAGGGVLFLIVLIAMLGRSGKDPINPVDTTQAGTRANAGQANSQPNYALKIDRDNVLKIESIISDGSDPITIEGWFFKSPDQDFNSARLRLGDAINWFEFYPKAEGFNLFARLVSGDRSVYANSEAQMVAEGRWQHIALVHDLQTLTLFIDGKVARRSPAVGQREDMKVLTVRWSGMIDEVRVSNIARYDAEFEPNRRFSSDAKTLALYHFDEAEGVTVRDASGNGHDGTMAGAKWVKTEPESVSPIPVSDAIRPEHQAVQLFPLVDVTEDVPEGAWEHDGDAMIAQGRTGGSYTVNRSILFPLAIDGNYEIAFSVEHDRKHNMDLDLPIGDRRGRLIFVYGNKIFFEPSPRSKNSTSAIVDGGGHMERRRYDHLITVKLEEDDAVTVQVDRDGKRVFEWKGQLSDLQIPEPEQRQHLSLRSLSIEGPLNHRFPSATLRMLTGEARLIRPVQSPASNVNLNRGLVAHWTFDDATGTTAKDSSGNNHHGTLKNMDTSAWVTDAKSLPKIEGNKGALRFDGNDDRVAIPQVLEGDRFSISMWFKQEGKFGKQIALLQNDGWKPGDIHLQIRPTMNLGLGIYVPDTGKAWFDPSSKHKFANGPTGGWQHIVITLDGAEGGVRVYVNGKLDSEAKLTGLPTTPRLGPGLIGDWDPLDDKGAGSKQRAFQGLIDDVRIYNRALSEAEIALLAGVSTQTQSVQTPPPAGKHFALLFDGSAESAVEFPTLQTGQTFPIIRGNHSLTVESWVMRDPKSRATATVGIPQGLSFSSTAGGGRHHMLAHGVRMEEPQPSREGPAKWTHYACVFDREKSEYRLYVDGKLAARMEKPDDNVTNFRTPKPFTIWGGPGVSVGETRLSSVARYDQDFTPKLGHEPDEHTIALYKFDEGNGEVLNDSSGNKHHGKIIDAKWVPRE